MYRDQRKLGFTHVQHLTVVADPATHSKQELMFGVAYSWESDSAAYLDVQRIAPGQVVLPEAVLGRQIAGRAQSCRNTSF
jgi:hypothetical protein